MKITLPRQDLLSAVNKVKSVVAAKTSLPILSHVLMETGESCVTFSGTDLKVSIECEVDCSVERPGSATVNCQRLAMLLAELPDMDVTLDAGEGNFCYLRCGQVETRLFTMPSDEFPPIRSFSGGNPLQLKQSMLRRLFLKTSFAICTDQARYNLTGLLFQLRDRRLTVVATDGRRMSVAISEEEVDTDQEIKVIIPSKMIHELEALLDGDGESLVSVQIEESQAGFFLDRLKIVTSLIEGNFPNYDAVLPKKHDREVVLDTETFMSSVRRAFVMTSDKFRNVRLVASDGALKIIVKTPEVGEQDDVIPAEYSGDPVEIAFNPAFILDVLKNIEGEKVCLMLKDTSSPGLIKPYTDAPEDTYLNVVMPIRI